MRMRSPIGNTITIRASELGKVRIYLRHGWKPYVDATLFEKVAKQIRKSTAAFRDFDETIQIVTDALSDDLTEAEQDFVNYGVEDNNE